MITFYSSAFVSAILGFLMLFQSTGQQIASAPVSAPVYFSHLGQGEDVRLPEEEVAAEAFFRFACTGCQGFAKDTLPKLKEWQAQHAGARLDITLVTDLQDPAESLPAQGLYCAESQNRFWEMLNALASFSGEATRAEIIRLADEIQLEPSSFGQCLDDPETQKALAKESEKASQRQVSIYPTLLINQYRLIHYQPWENVERILKILNSQFTIPNTDASAE